MKKLILIIFLVIGISGIARADWFTWLYLDWEETKNKNYLISVEITRSNGRLIQYDFPLGDLNKYKLDVDSRSSHLIKVYSDGELMFEMTYLGKSFSNSGSGRAITF